MGTVINQPQNDSESLSEFENSNVLKTGLTQPDNRLEIPSKNRKQNNIGTGLNHSLSSSGSYSESENRNNIEIGLIQPDSNSKINSKIASINTLENSLSIYKNSKTISDFGNKNDLHTYPNHSEILIERVSENENYDALDTPSEQANNNSERFSKSKSKNALDIDISHPGSNSKQEFCDSIEDDTRG